MSSVLRSVEPVERFTNSSRPLSRRLAVGGSALIVLAGVWVSGLLLTSSGTAPPVPLDLAWSEWMQHLRVPVLVRIAEVMNLIGGGRVNLLLTIALVVLTAVRFSGRAGLLLSIAAAISDLDVQLMKELVGRVRPPDGLIDVSGTSFPSGHTANAAVLAISLALLVRRRSAWVAAGTWIGLMGLSRTYLDVHWSTDVLAGALCGGAVAVVVWCAVPDPVSPLSSASRSEDHGTSDVRRRVLPAISAARVVVFDDSIPRPILQALARIAARADELVVTTDQERRWSRPATSFTPRERAALTNVWHLLGRTRTRPPTDPALIPIADRRRPDQISRWFRPDGSPVAYTRSDSRGRVIIEDEWDVLMRRTGRTEYYPDGTVFRVQRFLAETNELLGTVHGDPAHLAIEIDPQGSGTGDSGRAVTLAPDGARTTLGEAVLEAIDRSVGLTDRFLLVARDPGQLAVPAHLRSRAVVVSSEDSVAAFRRLRHPWLPIGLARLALPPGPAAHR